MPPLALVQHLATRWHHCIVTLPWIALLTLSVSIELVSSSARVTSVKSTQGGVRSDGHPDPKIGPQVYLGPIKMLMPNLNCTIAQRQSPWSILRTHPNSGGSDIDKANFLRVWHIYFSGGVAHHAQKTLGFVPRSNSWTKLWVYFACPCQLHRCTHGERPISETKCRLLYGRKFNQKFSLGK